MKRHQRPERGYAIGASATLSGYFRPAGFARNLVYLRPIGIIVAAALLSGCPRTQLDEEGLRVEAGQRRDTASASRSNDIGSSPSPSRAQAGAQTKAAGDLILPIELLGPGLPNAPIVADAELGVSAANLAKASQVWFQCHRCGFYTAPEFEKVVAPLPKVKASLRVIGGVTAPEQINAIPWIDITDANVLLDAPERLQGGVNGGFYTTKITLKLTPQIKSTLVALPRYNRIQFRFNGSDGESNGYRILQLQLRDDNAANIGQNTIVNTDPKIEKDAGRVASPAADAGRALWYAENSLTKSSVVTRKIKASCSACHSEDGRDLQYFNYSNNAIVQRSRFHGLSETQGKQIAAYIRYAQRDVPHVAKARPWNPPYQPGPGLDSRPLNEWAAGAGLDAVLTTSQQALNALLGKPLTGAPSAITQADIDKLMNANATSNVRETAIALQFPDWNAWLPSVHPMDVWPEGANPQGSFKAGADLPNGRKDPWGRHKTANDWLTAKKSATYGDWSHLTANDRNQAKQHFFFMGWEAYNFLGGGRGDHINVGGTGPFGAQIGAANLKRLADAATMAAYKPAAYTDAAFIERSTSSMMLWNLVKQWELIQKYGLEGNQKWFLGGIENGQWVGRGEARGWAFNTPGAFFVAPHMLYQKENSLPNGRLREWYFAWETDNIPATYYHTNQWYQAQMTINAGAQDVWTNYPMDWPYLTRFDELMGRQIGDATPVHSDLKLTHFIRLLQGRVKSAQHVMNKIPLNAPDPNRPEELFFNQGRPGRAQAAKHLQPVQYMDQGPKAGDRSPFRGLDTLAPGLLTKVVNGSMNLYLGVYGATNPADWRRCDPANTSLGEPEPVAGFSFCLDRSRTAVFQDANGKYYLTPGNTTLYQRHQYSLTTGREMGADAQRLQQWEAWRNRMWP